MPTKRSVMDVLVIDVGGSHVKLRSSSSPTTEKFESHPDLTPAELVAQVQHIAADWQFEVVSLGIPSLVGHQGVLAEPGNLGKGWIDFDFTRAFGKPARICNDAAMQALGAYRGGRMLFLGLGTGVGSTLVADRILVPLELGELKYSDQTICDLLGKKAFEQAGQKLWRERAIEIALMLKSAFSADDVVLGGGKAGEGLLDPLPTGLRAGGNDDAISGGFRLWDETTDPHDQPPSSAWRVVP